MKRTILALAGLGLVATLSACGPKSEQNAAKPPAPATPAATEAMAGMSSSPVIAAKATGVVTAVDRAAGVITIDHEPIPEAQWPAMTMGFKAAPALAQTVRVGDKVAFDITIKEGAGEITAIKPQ